MARWRKFWAGYCYGARLDGTYDVISPPWFAADIERELADVRYMQYRTGVRIGREVALALREARRERPDVARSPAATCHRAILEHLGWWDWTPPRVDDEDEEGFVITNTEIRK